MLIDPGDDINNASEGFCKRARVCTKSVPYIVNLANKSTENMNVTINKVTVSIGPYSESFKMESNPLKYDVILGESWCAKHKASIDR